MRFRRACFLLAFVTCASAAAGCAALTGLDQIQEEDCAPSCGQQDARAGDATASHDSTEASADVAPEGSTDPDGRSDAPDETTSGDATGGDATDARSTADAGHADGGADAGDAADAQDGTHDATDAMSATDAADAAADAAPDVAEAGTDARVESGDAGTVCSLANLVIAEVRSRGTGGAADEFVVLFNPTSAPVTVDATWTIQARSSTAGAFATRWTGGSGAVPAHGFYLIAGTGYAESPAADDHLSTGITDATALRLERSGNVVDTLCFRYDATTLATLQGASYACEGTPADNLPHDDSAGAASNVDQSLRRSHCVDTGDNSADFAKQAPATPRSTTSPPEP